MRDSGQSAGLVKIKRAQISFKKSKNVCSSKKDIQLRQSKTRLSCEFQGSNGDADGYGFSRNDFNRHEQSQLEMAVKTRTRLGNKMQQSGAKTI